MSKEEKSLSELISSIDQVEGIAESEQGGSEKEPVKKKSKGFVIVVSILLFLILGIGGYYVYNQYFSEDADSNKESSSEENLNENSLESFLDGNYPIKEITVVEILEVKDGDFEEETQTCNDPCTVDLKVMYYRDSYESEFVVKDILFNHAIQSITRNFETFTESEADYFLLRYGSGNESGTYLLNDAGYVSEDFCSPSSGRAILWNDRHLIYEDCGVGSWYTELTTGISVFNLESGVSTSIATPIKGSEDKVEVSYLINSVNKSNSTLTISECKYSDTIDECDKKEIDLLEIEALK